MRIIIDFDGTLTAEETQVELLAQKSLATLANEIVHQPYEKLCEDYAATRARLLAEPYRYGWEVNGLLASYCDEGAFILNTTTLQVMLSDNPEYFQAVASYFQDGRYDPVARCTNHLFHRHTAEIPPAFRPCAVGVLQALVDHPERTPVILTNSLGDKVVRQLSSVGIDGQVPVLGDTRQYDMDPDWEQTFPHPTLGALQVWPLGEPYQVDLRRPIYHRALLKALAEDPQLVVVADTFSLPGAMPLLMGIPFFLVRTPYTPEWCVQAVRSHPLGRVLEDLAELPEAL